MKKDITNLMSKADFPKSAKTGFLGFLQNRSQVGFLGLKLVPWPGFLDLKSCYYLVSRGFWGLPQNTSKNPKHPFKTQRRVGVFGVFKN